MSLDENKEEEGDEEGVRRNENSPKIRPVEQCVPPVLGIPNVGRNASSHSVPSHPTYQTVPNGSCRSCKLILVLFFTSRPGVHHIPCPLHHRRTIFRSPILGVLWPPSLLTSEFLQNPKPVSSQNA
ncbi:hypothetical protein DVH24_014194 [Malus domestica]|uniref:Uncharacterized protein n=1 Tax=Malus domestica TaxID=3750 RepID=A0A498JD65_MALDO|nr:hypothetical protein DVH24_014194 [Malus domestica]